MRTHYQNKRAQNKLSREISKLKELGVEQYEIDYLIHLKQKQEIRKKWEE